MKFASGTCGRVFYLHIEHDEDLICCLSTFVREHAIKAGVIHLIGAIKHTRMVCGPNHDSLPPDFHWEGVAEPHELIGTGFIRTGPEGPVVHLHASVGRWDVSQTGCLRERSQTYILIEAVIIEFSGIEIPLKPDPLLGVLVPDPKSSLE